MTCKRILEEPWSLPTINEVYGKRSADSHFCRSEPYEACCEAILLDESATLMDYCGDRYRRASIVSVQRSRDIRECLYKIAKDMRDVLWARGRL